MTRRDLLSTLADAATIALAVLLFWLLVTGSPLRAQTIEHPKYRLAPVTIQLDAIPTSSLVVMLLRDVMRVPYVVAPDVLADRRPTSVKLIMPRNEVPQRVVTFLRRSGFVVTLEGGTVYVGRPGSGFSSAGRFSASPVNVPLGSPLDPNLQPVVLGSAGSGTTSSFRGSVEKASPDPVSHFRQAPVVSADVIVAYLPAHRDTDYFSTVISAVLPDVTFSARGDVKGEPSEGTIAPRNAPDVLVMSGSKGDIAKARKLVVTLDRARPMVAVKAVVMQVSNIKVRGSALSLLANLGGGKLQVGSFPVDAAAAQFVRIATGALSAVLSAVHEDSRFKVVATPNLAALSGGVATMNAGSQVPTVGAVSIAEGGTPVQSIVYRDSGITLTVRPVVRGDLIELDVREERSTFVRTTTGVEDSPTLQKSSASASVVLKSGESVVLAGLTEATDGNRREGLFGGLLGVRGRDKSESELLVLVTAELVPPPPTPPGTFIDVSTQEETDATDPLAPTRSYPDGPNRA